MGIGQTDLRELTKLHYATRFEFYAPGPNWPHVLEWLRRRVATINKTQIETRMHEPSVALDP
jgi:hypothetical protein